MAYLQGTYPVAKKRESARGIYDYTICCPSIAEQAQPGQFVHIRVDGFSLRRPISICETDPSAGTIRIVFEARGAGTEKLAQTGENGTMDLLGPLGNGFTLPEPGQKLIVAGGGIGVPPMLETARRFGGNTTAIIGFRSRDAAILEDDFKRLGCDTRLATDDGSAGYHGFVTGLLEQRLAEGGADLICACGPMPMLRGVVAIAQAHGIPTQVSLEERMGCGVGACLVCACKTVRDGREVFSHVCKDGPVFDGKDVVFG
ncbi:MAG: dihydroorotate dehydrogenase electron transfer subunit [Ruminococcaceae bacterium]|jgi:dihydroorotate dehydrogenase electron transfer subunit|nr:dihydroorotate dehydrogenase electron transfer subunit [Oscillospiraceae bacterium]